MDKLTQIKEVIEKEIGSYFENTDLFLVEANVLSNGKIEIFADGVVNITIDKCAEISRHMANFLESNGYVGEKYTLEVSSPGMDEPLKVKQQFEKQRNKQVDVVLKNGLKITGTMTASDENGITVIELVKQKNKTMLEEEHIFSYSEIKSVKKHFNFKL